MQLGFEGDTHVLTRMKSYRSAEEPVLLSMANVLASICPATCLPPSTPLATSQPMLTNARRRQLRL